MESSEIVTRTTLSEERQIQTGLLDRARRRRRPRASRRRRGHGNRARRQPRWVSSGRPASATVMAKSHQRSSGRSAAHLLQMTGSCSSVAVSAAQASTHSSLPSRRSTRLVPVCQRPGGDLGGLEPVVELAPGDVGNRGPDRARQDDALLVARDAALLAAVAVVLDDHHRLRSARPESRRGRDGRRTSSGAPKSTVLEVVAHCSTSPGCSSMPSFSAKSLRS